MNASAFHRPRTMTVYQEKSASVANLMEAVALAMAEFTPIVRDGVGEVIRNGKRQQYRYATLDSLHRATKPALLKHKVVPRQDYCVSDEGVTLVTSLSLGDEYVCSVLPLRQYEDQQRQKAHMSYMRRTAYEGILCLSAEDDSDGADEQLTPGDSAAEKSVNGVPERLMWKQQEQLAKQAIAEAKNAAAVEDILVKVKRKIEACDMDPHSIGVMEELATNRINELRNSNKKEVAK